MYMCTTTQRVYATGIHTETLTETDVKLVVFPTAKSDQIYYYYIINDDKRHKQLRTAYAYIYRYLPSERTSIYIFYLF